METNKKLVEEFWKQVQKDYDIKGWELEWWNCKGEAECAGDFKKILLGDCDTTQETSYLLLHEVAHILAGPTKGHNPEWWQQFMTLLKKYNFKKHPKDNYEDYYNLEDEKGADKNQ